VQVAPDTASHPVQPVNSEARARCQRHDGVKREGLRAIRPAVDARRTGAHAAEGGAETGLADREHDELPIEGGGDGPALFIVTVHVVPDVASHPIHLANVDPAAGAAVSVTVLLLS
jgi:hypothetical protein